MTEIRRILEVLPGVDSFVYAKLIFLLMKMASFKKIWLANKVHILETLFSFFMTKKRGYFQTL